jgi:signal transduction histidine kinase
VSGPIVDVLSGTGGARALNRLRALALSVLGAALGIAAYRAQINALNSPHALAQVAVGWAYLFAGLVAWARRPANRMGPLLVLTGLALLARQLRYSDDPFLFTMFFILGDVGYALVAFSALAYPSGRVTDRAERALVVAGFTAALVLPFLVALFYGGTGPLSGFAGLSRDSLVNVFADPSVVEILQKTETVVFFGVLAAAFVVLIVRRFWRAAPRMRRILAPLAVAAAAFGLRAIFECVFTFVDRPFASDYLFWWQFVALFALPLTLVGGLLRAHWVRAGVGDLVLELEHAQPQELRDALARALGDPTLELAFWLPERETYVDAAGRDVELPENGARAVTYLENDDGPLAAIVHDPSLLEESKFVRAAGAAARLALENAQLQAETRAQLAEVKESRVRMVAAADEERKRIERDLHDGAQQRLAALALRLRTVQRRLHPGETEPAVEALLESAVSELQAANEELRELVRGVYPAILTEEGLAPALESLVLRNPLLVDLDVLDGRLPRRVEATAYFVTCEALANVMKHARASKASVCISRGKGLLTVEIADDGIGGARALENSGLGGLSDRVEALSGRFRVHSPVGEGTRIVAEIPCES